MSGLINKVKDALHSDKDKTHDQPEGTHGSHNSRAANAADPRIDSDRDHRANPTTTTGHTTTGHTAGGLGSTTGAGHTTGHSSGLPEGSVGNHNSRLANAADPRIDSDLDGSRSHGTGAGLGSHSTNTAGGLTGSTHSSGLHSGNTAGGLTGSHQSSGLPE
ncbi:period circadian, partial [Fusarium heterosporum]